MNRFHLIALCVALAANSLLPAGCVPRSETEPPPKVVAPDGSVIPTAVVERNDDGTVMVVGVLVSRNGSQGPYFSVVDARPGERLTGDEPILAVIVQPDGSTHGDDLSALVGSYVEFIGRMVEGASVDTSSPAVSPESFRILVRAAGSD